MNPATDRLALMPPCLAWAASILLTAGSAWGQAPAVPTPVGEVMGSAFEHTESAPAVLAQAWLVLPGKATGGAVFQGRLADAPPTVAKVPLVVFAHGSSGIAPAIKEWQKWLADELGIASVTPDSMQLKDRLTYKSPVGKDVYEKVHALRAQELALAMAAVPQWGWADPQKVVLAGTSEGAVSVARYRRQGNAPAEAGRMIFSWSCEDNYHVASHRTQLSATLPVLNIMSSTDVYFSPSNPWLGNPDARGHCATALKDSKVASVVLIPGAPHTLFNLPQAKGPTAAFLRDVTR